MNYELFNLDRLLAKGIKKGLTDEGSLIIISFHSLEDKKVMEYFTRWQWDGLGKILSKTVIRPTKEEIKENSASASAMMRIFMKN